MNVLGIIGSIASLISLFVPEIKFSRKLIRFLLCVVIAVFAFFMDSLHQKMNRIESIERVANQMVVDRDMKYTSLGFVQATLTFLEKNKDLYPDTYKRALDMCDQYKCNEPGNNVNMVGLSSAMSGLLKGLATIESEKN